MTKFTIYMFVLSVICSIIIPHPASPQKLSHSSFDLDVSIAEKYPSRGAVVPYSEANQTLDFMWILGEVTLVIITAALALLIYNRHLKKAVGKKTLELRNLNIHLEDKVEERTSALKKSREEYKAMYVHAEEERKRAKVALKSERDAIRQNLNFIDMISHEYRTPLSGLSSSIDILEKNAA